MRRTITVVAFVAWAWMFSFPAGAAIDGIYKPLDDAASMSVYVQTYNTGAVLVIFTPDARTWYVFLDPDQRDGISGLPDLKQAGT